MKRAGEIRLPFDHDRAAFERALERLGVAGGHRILRKSLDARNKRRIAWVYAIGVPEPGDDEPPVFVRRKPPDPPPVIVGAGPGGLFAAHWLALHGVRSVVLEQGEPLRPRLRAMARFLRAGALDRRSNLCFGAGGAGAYSDGKLTTRTHSPHVPFIMETLVACGAPEEVRYLHAPHLGSNGIRRVIETMIGRLEQRGVDLRFGSHVASLEIQGGRTVALLLEGGERVPAETVLLCTGHSARPLYDELERLGLPLEAKPFAVGARLEHPSATIDRIQLGPSAGHPALGAARYQLAHTWRAPDGRQRALYSFCMCPGGFIVNAASDAGGVTSNGMSNAGRRGRFSNAAMVVNVALDDVPPGGPLRGLRWQQELERAAAEAANAPGQVHALPGQRLTDFLEGRAPRAPERTSALVPVRPAPLHEILPPFVVEAMRAGFPVLERKMRGLIDEAAVLVGVESRTSSPVRVLRDPDTGQSPGAAGLYPVGEGAGYAGGIVSAAADGIAAAQRVLEGLAAW